MFFSLSGEKKYFRKEFYFIHFLSMLVRWGGNHRNYWALFVLSNSITNYLASRITWIGFICCIGCSTNKEGVTCSACLLTSRVNTSRSKEKEGEDKLGRKGKEALHFHSWFMLLLHIPIYTGFCTTNFGILCFSRIFRIQELVILVP